MAERVAGEREQCQHTDDAGERCARPGRMFPRNVGPRPAGWWCVLHMGAALPAVDPERTAAALSRRAALDAVVRACLAAMRAGATGPELMDSYRKAEQLQQSTLTGVSR